MNDNLNERKVERPRIKEQMKIDVLIIPALVILIIMLLMVAVQQRNSIEQYQEAVSYLEADRELVMDSYGELQASVDFSKQVLGEIDLTYIEEIPEGVDMRIQLVLQALIGGIGQ